MLPEIFETDGVIEQTKFGQFIVVVVVVVVPVLIVLVVVVLVVVVVVVPVLIVLVVAVDVAGRAESVKYAHYNSVFSVKFCT